jgi:hypothetical protein
MESDEKKDSFFVKDKKARKARLIYGPWSKHDINELISLYEDNPILWNASLEGYRETE